MSSGFFQDFRDWYIQNYGFFSVAAEDSIVVVTIGNQSGGSHFNSHRWSILDSLFIIFMFSSSGAMQFVILVEDSDSAYCFG